MTNANDLYYMRARFYSPDLRRFINQDILLGNVADGQSLNRFAFVTGNPVSFVDPFGLSGEDIYNGVMDGIIGAIIGGGVAAIVIVTAPASAPVMAIIAVSGAGVGGFMMGMNGYEVVTGRDYWSGEQLSSSEIDYRKGHMGVDIALGFAGCTWFRSGSRDMQGLSDWEWFKLPGGKRWSYDNGLGTVRNDLYEQISHLPPDQRNINIFNTDWAGAVKNAPSGPGPGGRYMWPFGIAGSELCDCISE
jgi:RHS repeat-associated protein